MQNSKSTELKHKNILYEAFSKAESYLLNAPSELEFLQRCIAQNISVSDHKNLIYWELIAQYESENAQNPYITSFESEVLIIAANVPGAVLHQHALDIPLSHDKAHAHKLALSTFNGLVRNFANSYPGMPASALTSALQQVAKATVAKNDRLKQKVADELMHGIVRGAQHELAFEDILQQAALQYPGLTYRKTSVAEDLKGGDYVVVPVIGGPEIKIDVKSSLNSIENGRDGSENPFSIDHEGDIVIYSLIDPGDSFEIDQETAASRVHFIVTALQQALDSKAN